VFISAQTVGSIFISDSFNTVYHGLSFHMWICIWLIKYIDGVILFLVTILHDVLISSVQ